ncbi:MFS general substrate transporter [Hymenopellis radicata]|nr:MFS general substrate transporter [Hymenopellis radicata]
MSSTIKSSSDGRLEEKTDDDYRPPRRIIQAKDVDIGAHLLKSGSADLDPVQAAKARRKIDRNLLPLMCMITSLQFMDKVSLGSASIMGIREATHLTINEYNWLGTIFYLGYLAFEFPQNLCLQRFPVGKWMSLNIIVWATALCCHALCTGFSGLLVVRLILGACEGCITAGFILVSSMFYTQKERFVHTDSSSGLASIVSSFISYGVLHIKHSRLEPWQWFMIIIGMITFVTGVIFWFAFPDSPTTAWFLTPEERIVAVKRIQVEQTGIENKHFKMYQFTEALHDPKIWLFTLFSAVHTLHSSITNQRWIIVSSFGFTDFQNVLLGCVDGVLTTSGLMLGAFLAGQFYNGRAYVAVACYVPGILAAVLLNVLSEDNKFGLLFSFWLTALPLSPYSTNFVPSVNGRDRHHGPHQEDSPERVYLLGYCIGYAAGQFIWQKQYQPRNRVPWIIVGCTYLTAGSLLLVIRALLVRENARRDARGAAGVDEQYDHVYMERVNRDGTKDIIKVDKTLLDLTDIQNQDFRYVL